MTEREKLVQLIVEKQDCGLTHNSKGQDFVTYNAELADHLIANGVTVQQWISVEDRLPENGVWVLAWQKCGWTGIAQIEEDGWHWYTQDLVKLEDPSHWTPLPEPPKEE